MKVRMKDIAKAAGVSMTTVSMVLNDKGNISQQTRERVLQITRELEYVKKSTGGGVLLLGSVGKDFLSCLQMAFAEYGITCHHERVNHLDELPPDYSADNKISGVLIHGGQWQPHQLEKMGDLYPSVFLGSTIPKTTVDTVWVDNVAAMQWAADFLIAHGHQHIGLINGPDDSFPSAEKHLGFYQALRHAGPTLKGHLIHAAGFSIKDGEHASLELFSRFPHVTAIIAGEQSLGLGALNTVRQKGLRIPEDLSIVVFRDSPEFDAGGPPLTAIGLPFKDIAKEAALHMVRRIQNPDALGKRLLLKPKLIERGSVSRASS